MDDGNKGFMLFGVMVLTEGSFRKSASMNNVTQFDTQTRESNTDDAGGYDSDQDAYPSAGNLDRRRGVPWSEEEHMRFLLGLQKVGRGDWRGISKKYVKTRTPTQVASHAQKYFLRRNHTRRRRRSSLFDITTDSITVEDNSNLNQNATKTFETPPMVIKPLSVPPQLTFPQLNQLNNSPKPIRPIPILPPSSNLANLNLNKTKTITPASSLSLSITPTPTPNSSQQGLPSAFQAFPDTFNEKGGDNIIIVA